MIYIRNQNRVTDIKEEFQQKVLDVARVTRVVAGGKRFTFRAAVVVGNGRGRVGFGVAKGLDVNSAIEKAVRQAKKNFIDVKMKNSTIPHEVLAKYKSAKVYLMPAPSGFGVKAGGAVRVICFLAGILDIRGKILSKTSNKLNNALATIKALSALKPAKEQKNQHAQ